MRCSCCDKVLSSLESTRKFKLSGTYTDTCTSCLRTMDVETVDSRYQAPPVEEEGEDDIRIIVDDSDEEYWDER